MDVDHHNKFKDIKFSPKPRLCIGFLEHPAEMLLEMDAEGCLGQIPDLMWRVQKMNFQNYSDESVEDCKIVSSDMYRQKKGTIRQAAGSFLPREAGVYGSVDVMLLACTSMSFVLGTSDVHL